MTILSPGQVVLLSEIAVDQTHQKKGLAQRLLVQTFLAILLPPFPNWQAALGDPVSPAAQKALRNIGFVPVALGEKTWFALSRNIVQASFRL